MKNSSHFWKSVTQSIEGAIGEPIAILDAHDLGGGCINAASLLSTSAGQYFVKFNSPDRSDMFVAEAAGLRELAKSTAIRVPAPIANGTTPESAFLVLEYLELGSGSRHAAALGRGLAALHRVTQLAFGWTRDNTIGSTAQINSPCDEWVSFWGTHRLGYQLSLAERDGLDRRALRNGERLRANLAALFGGYRPQPSLLHGDLWSGNQSSLADGTPVMFDPAVYYGDRETDIAMTELFGGFPAEFYRAYRDAWPLDAGYDVRKTLYNLYHVLNHHHLFGGGYGQQAARMIDSLLAEIG